jgi:hypothetical protein
MSKYFKRGIMPSDAEIVLAIRDIEVRLDAIERETMPDLPCYNHKGGSIKLGEQLDGSTKLQ